MMRVRKGFGVAARADEQAILSGNARADVAQRRMREFQPAEHAAGFIGASEELRAKIEMPTARKGILVNLVAVSG